MPFRIGKKSSLHIIIHTVAIKCGKGTEKSEYKESNVVYFDKIYIEPINYGRAYISAKCSQSFF